MMLQKHVLHKIIKSSIALLVIFLINLFPNSNSVIVQENIINDNIIPVYAIDYNGYVARINSSSNQHNTDDIKYIIGLLTTNSYQNINLPKGFLGIIPENTKLLSYDLNNGLLKLFFSKELLNIDQENEEKMLESIIYSLCELNNVDKIQIYVEKNLLTNLPHSQKKLPEYLDKEYGINKEYTFNDIKNTTKTTIYYVSKIDNNLYYVPITKISNEKVEPVELIVKELKSSPIYEPNLISYLNASYELKDYQILENTISLSFDNTLIANLDDQDIEEKVKYTLALSLRDTYHINDINILINGR